MNIVNIPIDKLKEYENNPRRNDRAVNSLAESIKKYGFKVPCVIDKDNVLITGHTRFKACKKLGYTEIPCIVADDLTEEQINEFRIADNKTGEISQWDKLKLSVELNKLPTFKPLDMGFKSSEMFDISKGELAHYEHKDKTQGRRSNILNLEKGDFAGVGKYDIPEIEPIEIDLDITEWIGFNYVLSDKSSDEEKLHKGVHFFIDDYQFERVWERPERYIEALKKYGAVLSPDFSPYSDMPMATQIYNHYRKHWVAVYWQNNGITVIPTIRGSADPRGREWFLDGEPVGGIVCISSMWYWDDTLGSIGEQLVNEMIKKLKPKKLLVYGKESEHIKFKNIEYIETFSQKRWQNA